MFRSLLFIFASVMLASCGSKAELSFDSPDQTAHLTLKGKKSSSLDPWMLDVIAKNAVAEKTFNVEFFQSELTAETVQVEWNGNSEAVLILKGQDDFINHFVVLFNGDEITITDQ